VDPYSARGGGQVVLEELLRIWATTGIPAALAMPEAGRQRITVPSGISQHDSISRFLASNWSPVGPTTFVSNANASHLETLRLARRFRGPGRVVNTVAIVHNYPRNAARLVALKQILKRYDTVVLVEPGLRVLSGAAVIPSWLSISASDAVRLDKAPSESLGLRVKAFGRPDPPKGLHLLAPIYRELTARGIHCEVALGETVSASRRYSAEVTRALQPWLVEGRRGPEWIQPGDIFLSTSTFGEAACLSAQEAMYRRAVVVAPRIGLMPYLSPSHEGIETYEVGSVDGALNAVRALCAMTTERRLAEGSAGRSQVQSRAGAWYDEVVELLEGSQA
jgi:hypothetical protein